VAKSEQEARTATGAKPKIDPKPGPEPKTEKEIRAKAGTGTGTETPVAQRIGSGKRETSTQYRDASEKRGALLIGRNPKIGEITQSTSIMRITIGAGNGLGLSEDSRGVQVVAG
jgi:hypothetical protein